MNHVYAAILRQPALEQRLDQASWLSWVLPVCALLPLPLLLLPSLPWRIVAGLSAGCAAMHMVMWWARYLRSAVRQNSPANACLVPGLRRQLLTLTALLWLALSVALGGVFGVLTQHPGYAALLVAAVLVWVLLTQQAIWLAAIPSLLVFASMALMERPLQRAGAVLAAWGEPAVTLAGLLLLAPAGAWGLVRIFPQGGERHWNWMHTLRRRQTRARSGLQAASRTRAAPRYASTVRMVLELAQGAPARPHATLAVFGLTVLALAYSRGGTPHAGNVALMPMLWMLQMLPAIMYPQAAVESLHRHRAEQALLMLAPCAPAPAALNRALAALLLRRALLTWAGSLLCLLLAYGVFNRGLEGAAFLLAAGALTLPAAATPLRDYAVLAQPRYVGYGPILLGLFGLVGVGVVAMITPSTPGRWLAFATPFAILGAVMIFLGWRRMLSAPPALPAGRKN